MKYHIEITDKILKKLEKLPEKEKQRIIEVIDSLTEDPRPDGYKKLKGSLSPVLYRIRVGNYRIVYSIEDKVLFILIVEVGHRKDIYR